MRAVIAKGFGKPSVLSVSSDVPVPRLTSPEHVLLRVKATAVNRGDTAQRKGFYPPPPNTTDIMGLEACGVVESVGSNVSAVSAGDKVMALLPGGGYGEYVSVHAGHLLPLPRHMSFEDGAAIAEVFLTAWQCLQLNMRVKKSDHVLLHAGASGVGTAAAQLTQKVLGGTAVVTCSEKKVPEALKYAKYAVSRTPTTISTTLADGKVQTNTYCFEDKIRNLLGKKPLINAVIDPVFGGSYLTETINVCADDAEITVLAMMGGATLEKFNASVAFRKRISIKFSTLRSRDDAYKSLLVKSFADNALPFFDDSLPAAQRVVPVVDKVLPIGDVAKAHELIDASDSIGKIVLTF